MKTITTRARRVLRACVPSVVIGFGALAASRAASPASPLPEPLSASELAALAAVPRPASPADFMFVDSLVGQSRKLRALFVTHAQPAFAVSLLQRLFGDSAVDSPGIYSLSDSALTGPFSLITLVPFTDKLRGRIGDYRLGYWPSERRAPRSEVYANPDGFIRVTPANEDTWVSQHFQLRDFLTHDQEDVWPKYLVLDARLVDKLELVMEDLTAHGVPVHHMTIMSGFRTPEYNREGVGRGRVRDSRHQFGDAADVFVDNGETGRMSDLNHDGRVNTRDARVILQAVDRVEAAHPDLVGGAGIYRATRQHGPFIHIDARGVRARWGRG